MSTYQRLESSQDDGLVDMRIQQQQPYAPLYPSINNAVPLQTFPVGSQPSVVPAPAPFVGTHIEPVSISYFHRLFPLSLYLIILTLFGFNVYFYLTDNNDTYGGDQSMQSFLIGYCLIMIILIPVFTMIKLPRRLEFTPNCVVLHTTFVSHSIAYERINSVEVLPSVCCWNGSGCTFPKGQFTAFRNGLFIRTADCGQSIAFTPTNMERVVAHMRTHTPLQNRIMSR